MKRKILILGLIFFFISILLAQNEWTIVYVKSGDNIFHLEGCKELEGFGKTSMMLNLAIKKGFKPCPICLKNFDPLKIMPKYSRRNLEKEAKNRRIEFIKLNPDFSQNIKNAILSGDILIGMTKEQVIASRGEPVKVNKTTTIYGVDEQWIMFYETPFPWDEGADKYQYIYFFNGKATGWQSR